MSGSTLTSPNALFDPGSAAAQQSSIFGTAAPLNAAPGLGTPTNALAPQAIAPTPAAGQPAAGQPAPAAQPDQAPAISPMWANWAGFDGTPSGYSSTNPNPFGGAVPASTNPGFMTFAQAQAQAAVPGQNPFPFYDPSHPMWQLMFNQYTNMGKTDPRLLFAQAGQGGGGGADVSSGPGTG